MMATSPVTAMCNTSLRLSDASETDEQHPVSHHDIVALEMEMITAAIRDGSYSSQAYTDASWSHVQSEGGCNVWRKVKTKAPNKNCPSANQDVATAILSQLKSNTKALKNHMNDTFKVHTNKSSLDPQEQYYQAYLLKVPHDTIPTLPKNPTRVDLHKWQMQVEAAMAHTAWTVDEKSILDMEDSQHASQGFQN